MEGTTTRLSESALWDLSARYYQVSGLDAWESGTVPYYITSNSFIAHRYAEMICELVEDWHTHGHVDLDYPVYVIELGAGLGQFGYLCARALQRLQDKEFVMAPWRITYVLTDMQPSSVNQWMEHPKFEDLKDREMVDFAVVDANQRVDSLHLLHRDICFKAGSSIDHEQEEGNYQNARGMVNPVVLIANYVFDSIPMDAFRVIGDRLYEERARVLSKDGQGLDPAQANWLDNLDTDNMWTLHELSQQDIEEYYRHEDPELQVSLQRILKWYQCYFASHQVNFEVDEFAENSTSCSEGSSQDLQQNAEKAATESIAKNKERITSDIKDDDGECERRSSESSNEKTYQSCSSASFLLPIGGFRLMQGFRRLTQRSLALVLGDKGNSNPEAFYGLGVPHIAAHGSASFMVNQHALGLFSEQLGGFTLHSERQDADITVSVSLVPTISPCNGDPLLVEDPLKPSTPAKRHPDKGTFTSALFSLAVMNNNYMLERPDIGFPFDNGRGWKLVSSVPAPLKQSHEVAVNKSKRYRRLLRSFSELERFGPDDFYRLQYGWKNCMKEKSVKAICARLDLSYWDVETFIMHKYALEKRLSSARHHLKEDICRGLPKIVENWINVTRCDFVSKSGEEMNGSEPSSEEVKLTPGQAQQSVDVPFEVGRLFYELHKPQIALYYYAQSWEQVGEDAITAHNISLCLYDLDTLAGALEWMEKAVALDPAHENAKQWVEKIQAKLQNHSCWRKISDDSDSEEGNGGDGLSEVSPASSRRSPSFEWYVSDQCVRFDLPKS
eukprot:gb/GECG01010779.1/.p1 GENE.gb/GECG01010779.1/~~gb/GECG01010779.1/.p1  ORF type:complete len:784 (+),score=90.17 gb/GECG01010779.1/:1-2352(+)